MHQFKVGDKAIWKGGCVKATCGTAIPHADYPQGTEIIKVTHSPGFRKGWLAFKFPDCQIWHVTLDQIEFDTPTPLITVNGKPFTPEKGELSHYELLKELPGYPVGEILDIKHGLVLDYYHADSYPDFFAPVYKEGKAIEFVKYLSRYEDKSGLQPMTYGQSPKEWLNIDLIRRDYYGGLDLMYASGKEDNEDSAIIVLGHFNDGFVTTKSSI